MKALVTGATGYVGRHLVEALRRRGDEVRVLARDPKRAAGLERLGCEVRIADFESTDTAALAPMCEGMEVVFHLVSAMYGSDARFERIDVEGTQHLLEAAIGAGVRRFVYVSTLASYPLARLRDGAVVDETCPFDETGRLGPYSRAKIRTERIVRAANGRAQSGATAEARGGNGGASRTAAPGGLECVIVRLGQVTGDGYNVFLPQVCQRVGGKRVLLFGDGTVPLPLVHIDNAVDALVRAGEVPGIAGESFNIVDDECITQQDYLRLLREMTGGTPQVVRLPRIAYYAIGALAELAGRLRGKEPATNRHRVRTRLRRARWDCSKAKRELQWTARAPLKQGLASAFRDYAARISSTSAEPASTLRL